jgi:hypothetical protein
MTEPNLQKTTTLPAKKAWSLPEIIMIDRQPINGGARTSLKEANFTPIPYNPGKFVYNHGFNILLQNTYNQYIHS